MKKSWNRDAWVACALILTACQTVEGPGASLPPPRPVNQAAGLGAWSIPVDVDPLHGSAFERVQSEEGLRPLVAFPDVTHDLNTGRTTVTLSVTHAGAAPVELSVQVQSGRTLLTSSEQLRLGVVAPGGSLTVPLVFENPQAGGFPLTLSLRADATTASAPPKANFALQQVSGFVATASNSLGTLVPGQAVDGNLGTQWANEVFRAASAWLAVDTGAVRPMAAVRVKMTPFSGGASYRIEVSDDGTTWRSVSGPLRNTTWQLETKVFTAPTEARHVRLVFTNDSVAPEGRFSVFEVGTNFQAGGTSPSPSPTPTPTPSPTPTPTPTPAVGVWVATANSSLGTLVPARAIDENLATQWANGTFRAPNAWLAVDTGAMRPMAAVRVKLPPFAGEVNYRIEVSDDGTTWRSVSGPLRNTSWQLETKLFSAPTEARHVRLVFTNDPAAPVSHFSVFELGRDFQAGGVSPTPTPTPSVTPSPSPTPTPTPTPSPSLTPPPPPGSWVRNFETDELGSDPSDFIDPLDEGYSYAWMPRVRWRVDVLNGSKQYIHDGLANMAFLNFRRWRGDALGTPDGRLPDRYFTELDVTPLRSYTYNPTGDQGTQVYYLDPVNYVEVLIKPNIFEVWAATNAPPFQSGGWNRLYWANISTAAGQTRRLGTEVDAQTGRMRVFVDGNELVTVSSPVLTPRPHWLALRGAGNIVGHDNIRIEPR